MDANILGDEVLPIGNTQVIDLMLADRFNGNNLVPVQVRAGQSAQRSASSNVSA